MFKKHLYLFFYCCFMVVQKQKKTVTLILLKIQHKSVSSYTSLCVAVIISPIQMPVLQKAGASSSFHKGHVPTKFNYFENTIISFNPLAILFTFSTISTRRNSFWKRQSFFAKRCNCASRRIRNTIGLWAIDPSCWQSQSTKKVSFNYWGGGKFRLAPAP